MPDQITEVLNHQQIADRIRRISWQIYEDFLGEQEVILAGIAERGYQLAILLSKELSAISPLAVEVMRIKVNKEDPLAKAPELDGSTKLEGKHVIVVDDVLNSGATLIYGVRYFLDYRVKGIKTAVLVDRSHKNYPVKGDFKGISLSTSIQEHVQVQLDKEPYSVVIS